jgi:hypothetical protein
MNPQDIEKEAVAPTDAASDDNPESDLVWGSENIGKEINRTARQVHHLHEIGALEGAVAKLGHKTFVGSKRKLHALPLRKAK